METASKPRENLANKTKYGRDGNKGSLSYSRKSSFYLFEIAHFFFHNKISLIRNSHVHALWPPTLSYAPPVFHIHFRFYFHVYFGSSSTSTQFHFRSNSTYVRRLFALLYFFLKEARFVSSRPRFRVPGKQNSLFLLEPVTKCLFRTLVT